MAGHVFVSYSTTDSAYVQQLIAHLAAAGVTVSTDRHGTADEQIASCSALVPVVTPQSAESEQVRQEIERAKAAYKPVLPLLRAGDIPADLAGMPYEDVTDGGMPPPHFIEHLRRLTASEPVSLGEAPRAADAVGPPTDAAKVKKRSRGLVIGLVVGLAVLLLICGIGAVVVIALASANADSAENAEVGDCLTGTTAEELDPDKLTKVDCGSAEARFTVVGRVEDKTFAEREAACESVTDTDFVFWTGREGGRGTVLCLGQL